MRTPCKAPLLKQPIDPKYPHSQVWRVLVTIVFGFMGLVFCISELMNLIITEKPHAHLAICSLWILVLYLSIILWIPRPNIWASIENIDYTTVEVEKFRQKISGSLDTVSTLVAFSIAFVILSVSIFFTTKPFSNEELTVFKLVTGLFTVGVFFFIVTLEVFDTCLNPTFDSAQIERLYTKGWWLYTSGLYSIVVALLLYVYLLEPCITIIGTFLFIFASIYYLKTPCKIKTKYQKGRIDK